MAMRRFFGQLATIACLLSLVYEPPARAQSPRAQDEVRKADFEKRMPDIKRRQSAVLYSDKASRTALLTERATMIGGDHGEERVDHAEAIQSSDEHTCELQ